MASDLDKLAAKARKVSMTPAQEREQRRSFAFGNTKIENDRITREMVDEADELIEQEADREDDARSP